MIDFLQALPASSATVPAAASAEPLTANCCAAILSDPCRLIRAQKGCRCLGAGRARPLSPGRGVAARLRAGIVTSIAVLGCERYVCRLRRAPASHPPIAQHARHRVLAAWWGSIACWAALCHVGLEARIGPRNSVGLVDTPATWPAAPPSARPLPAISAPLCHIPSHAHCCTAFLSNTFCSQP